MLNDLVPLTCEEVEAGGKGMSSFLVEVPLRHLIVDIVNQLQALLQVSADLVVGLSDVATVVVVVDSGDRLVKIGHADVMTAQLIVLIGLREAVDEDEVSIGTNEQSLGTSRIILAVSHETRLGSDAVQDDHSLVDRVDGGVEAGPQGGRRVARR